MECIQALVRLLVHIKSNVASGSCTQHAGTTRCVKTVDREKGFEYSRASVTFLMLTCTCMHFRTASLCTDSQWSYIHPKQDDAIDSVQTAPSYLAFMSLL